ncbi:MAG: amidohydrolase family protein [Novosphingobium sp.]
MNDMILISVDDHIVEPADMFEGRMPEKFKDRAPHVVTDEQGRYSWQFEGRRTLNVALNAVVGRPRDQLGFEPNAYDHIRKGCYDVHARIDDMNVNGIFGSLNFPTFPGFSFETFGRVKDRELALEAVRAYNDWHIDAWCGPYPERFIPMVSLPVWDMPAAVAELKRCIKKGARTISLPPFVHTMGGLPSIHDDYWKPLWTALVDEGIPISIHLGAGGGSDHVTMDSPIGALLSKGTLSSQTVAAEWLWSDIFRQFKDLRIILSEGGIGWLPYFLERVDLTHKNHGAWMRKDWGGKLPSEVFREHFYVCFIEDESGVDQRKRIGVDIITFECDYPHADVTWPETPEVLWNKEFRQGAIGREDIDKITHLNAMRALNWDPFGRIARHEATVGALRARATHVDMTPITHGGIAPAEGETNGFITAGDVLKRQFPDQLRPPEGRTLEQA